jgi:hypothetical protein
MLDKRAALLLDQDWLPDPDLAAGPQVRSPIGNKAGKRERSP